MTKTARPWSKDALLRILVNPLYAGYTRCGDERFPGEHPAIIASDEFDGAPPEAESDVSAELAQSQEYDDE